jgi:hypothetical protein
MAEVVYILCGVTSIFCALLLLRGYRRKRSAFLLWSSLCFGAFALNNILLVIDLIILPTNIDLSIWRSLVMVSGFMFLLYGFIWKKG